MSLSQNASLELAPLFARIVLAAIVLPAGYVSIFRTSNFSNQDAARIEAMGSPAKMIEESVEKIKPVALREETQGESDKQDKQTKDESEKSGAGANTMRNLNHFVLRLDDCKVPQPLIVGWVCAIAELVGGFVLLVGLFTRWFALLLFIGIQYSFAQPTVSTIYHGIQKLGVTGTVLYIAAHPYDMATSAQRIALGVATGKNAFIRQRLDRDLDVVESFANWSRTLFA